MVYPDRRSRRSPRGLFPAGADIATPHSAGISLHLHYLGVHLPSDPFRGRNISAVSDGRSSFSDRWRSAVRLDAFERRTASHTGQLESRGDHRRVTVARRKRWGDEGRTGDSLQLGCGIDHDCSDLDGSFGAVAKGPRSPNSTCRYRPGPGLRGSYSVGRTLRPRW